MVFIVEIKNKKARQQKVNGLEVFHPFF